MIRFLVKKCIKNSEDTNNQQVRERYGVLGGILGILCNIVLFAVKLTIGIVLNAFAILSDAFNNLTDSFSSIVSIISAKLSNKKPDKDHPFGHGRIEYVATLIVSFMILIVGFQLLKTSIEKLISGIQGDFEVLATGKTLLISMIILFCSLFVKLWMFSYNRYLGKKINSSVLLATSVDSISDVLTSFSIIVATLLGGLLLKDNYFYVDSIMGFVVGTIICINGFKIIFSTIGDLLGRPASKEDYKRLEDILLSNDKILGIHDLMIHDYGPGRKFASVHAEIDATSNIIEAHEIIDELEQICYGRTNIELTIHMDPIDIHSQEVINANFIIQSVIQKFDHLSYHDLRITNGENNINVIFDLVVPYEYDANKIKEIIASIKKEVKELNPLYTLVIKIDHSFNE